MLYSTRKQTEHFEEALVELGVLGLLEIEGQKLLRESAELQEETGDQPAEKTLDAVKRGLWKQKQKTRIARAAGVIRPVFVRAAVVFFAVFLGAGSVIMASANAREVLYRLLFSEHERYIEINPIPQINDSFVDLEEYQAAGATFGPTYVPEGVELIEVSSVPYVTMATYEKQTNNDDYTFMFFSITEMTESAVFRVDSEDADRIERFMVGDSEGLLIVKGEFTGITWYVGNELLDVYTNLPTEEAIRFAQGIRSL